MTAVFLVSFIVGLLLAVRVMLYGVERDAGSPFAVAPDQIRATHTPPEPKVSWWLPLVAAMLVGFGLAGYIVLRRTGRFDLPLLVGTASGVILAVLASRLVRKAAAFVPEHDPDDPRYVLQGHVARVTAPIGGNAEGQIAYSVEGASHVARARALDGAAVATGTEVVIERIEDGVAYVEPWSQVEERL